jgi:anaerobic ribonucleoside-triphosphate reductase activating protein
MKIRLATPNIQKDSIVDGEGIRGVIWTQGCPHNCPGCHNPGTHSTDAGILVDIEEIKQEIDTLESHNGITFSGGDPMVQAKECGKIAKYCHQKELNVWCYTGYTYEQLIKMAHKKKEILDFLKEIDVLVDGKFILEEKSYDSVFRGSKNQRLIDVKKSLESNKVVSITKFDKNNYNTKGRKNKYMFV